MSNDGDSRDTWPPEPYDEEWHTFKRSRPMPTNMVIPGPGQESVWDYPRPPVVQPVSGRVVVEFAGVTLADSGAVVRVCEMAGPPCYYIPRADVRVEHLEASALRTMCEFKGTADYWNVRVGDHLAEDAAWGYAEPRRNYEALEGHVAFYAGKMDRCTVGGEEVMPQEGDYYGGWVTPDLVGPFKGKPGTEAW